MNIYHIFKLILTLITSLIRRQFMNIKTIKIWKIMKVKRTKTPVTSIINYILKMLISQKNTSVQIALQISCMSEAPGPKKFGRVSSI